MVKWSKAFASDTRTSPAAPWAALRGARTPSTSWVSVRSVCVRASMQQPARKGNGATAEKYAVTERRLRSEDNHLQKERRNFLTTRIPTWKCLWRGGDRKSTRLNSSHSPISYAGFCLKKKN